MALIKVKTVQDARSKWFDHGVRQAIRDGIKQVVVIAAGYDTRSYRKEMHPSGVKVRIWLVVCHNSWLLIDMMQAICMR